MESEPLPPGPPEGEERDPEHHDEDAQDVVQSFNMDYESMPMHFLAEGDDPPVIMIPEPADNEDENVAGELPMVKIRRNYACAQCDYLTQNPRSYLTHLRHVHNERMRIYECPHCTYASRHSQKMHRHVSMVHNPHRGDRRRPGPPPRQRDEYYADFVNELHKRQELRKKRQEMHLQSLEDRLEQEGGRAKVSKASSKASSKAASKAASREASKEASREASTPTAPSQTPAEVCGAPRAVDDDDDDDEDRLVIANCDDEDESDLDGHRSAAEDVPDAAEHGDIDEADDDLGEAGDLRDAEDLGEDDAEMVLEEPASPRKRSKDKHDRYRDVRMDVDLVTGLYSCSSCDFTSRTPSLVARHESVVHLKKRFYRCNKCSYVTHMRARYTKHYKYHTMPLIKCEECEFRTPYKWNLDRHIKNHSGFGKYKCRACSFSSEIRQSLTVHEMNHHDPPVGPPNNVPHRRRQNKVGATELVNAALSAHLYGSPGRKDDADRQAAGAAGASPGGTPRRPDADAATTSSSSSSSSGAASGRLPLYQALRCSLCDFRTPFFADMSRHMAGVHGNSKGVRVPPTLTPAPQQQAVATPPSTSVKRPAKPLPNLIPIQATALPQTRTTPTPTPAAANGTAPVNGGPSNGDPSNGDEAIDTAKKKNSFFDQLRLYPGNVEGSELVCVHCGHEAKCLSELVRHTKLHQGTGRGVGTSTRCQHCRHRCKTSADLAVHLKACAKAAAAAAEAGAEAGEPANDDLPKMDVDRVFDGEEFEHTAAVEANAPPGGPEDDSDHDDDVPVPADDSVPRAPASQMGVETGPGYGLVANHAEWTALEKSPKGTTFTSRKVFKCPHCTFWASTASRFHVHMVGHLNKKPFACSVCKYRSNWRWDITKHIRLKEARDASHADAKTLMTDETGRRNYSKYNLDLLWLKIAEPDPENLHPMLASSKVVTGSTTSEAGASYLSPPKSGPGLSSPLKAAARPIAPKPPVVPASKFVTILPAPPKLTRAPIPSIHPSRRTSSPGGLLRPPPPLRAAAKTQNSSQVVTPQSGVRTQSQGQHQAPPQALPQQSLKRPADTPVPKVGSDPKKSNTDIKRTVWRCKQCHFRDGDRAVVLSHVKGHYRQQQEAALAKNKNAQSSFQESKPQEPQQSLLKKAPFRCDTCPFVSACESVMQSHVNCHKQRDDVFFKCFYCPFYVATKEEVIQHMTVHQQSSKGESSSTSSVKSVPSKSSSVAPSPTPSHAASNKMEAPLSNVQVKKEVDTDPPDPEEEVQPSNQAPGPPPLDFHNAPETPVCWVHRDGKLQKMLRCRYCPHVNLRRNNMQEHEKMHSKRSHLSSEELSENPTQHSPYPCPDCSYVCNNAGVLSSHMKVHFGSYPQAYAFYDPYKSERLQMKEIIEKFSLKMKTDALSQKSSPPKDPVDTGNENKLSGINVMSLLDPNQSLTDAVLAMKKKFNLELDGEPFAEPVEDSAESPPCSPLKQLNDGADPTASEMHEEKQLHFCVQCPARFLFRKELGIHSRFHNLYLIHKCDHCTYTARQRPHLQAHYKVHSHDYQDRTNALLKMYSVNKEYPKPRVVCVNINAGVPGTVWIVVNTDFREAPAPTANFVCGKCPASFFKNDAYQAHLTLHGSNNPHKCPICDYAVRTYGNLIKHMITHGCRASVAKKILQGRMAVPESLRPPPGTETNDVVVPKEEPQSFESEEQEDQSRSQSSRSNDVMDGEQEGRDDFSMDVDDKEESSIEKRTDDKDRESTSSKSPPPPPPGFASGSTDFVYPTYCRNGRVKVKRFKCQKCPSAFEKKDQYLVHVSLHGSKQKYKCTKCDYSVKFFANHIQHLRRHQISEDAKSKDDSEPQTAENDELIPEDTENIPSPSPPSPTRSAKTTGGKGEKLSVADKQAIMVLQQRRAKRAAISRESLDKNYWCSHCPYSSVRRDQVESHMRRHIAVSGVRNSYVCDHCDYSVPIKHFLRDHSKLHFDVSKAPRPDAYMICDGLELWASSGFTGKNKSKGKVLIFQDKGAHLTSDRFLPPLSCEEDEDSNGSVERIYINPKTFESENVSEVGTKEALDTSGEVENEEDGDSDSRKSEKLNDDVGNEDGEEVAVATSCSLSLPSEIKTSRSSSPQSVKSVEN